MIIEITSATILSWLLAFVFMLFGIIVFSLVITGIVTIKYTEKHKKLRESKKT